MTVTPADNAANCGRVPVKVSSRAGWRERLQRVVQTRVWGMTIDRSARIAPTALIDRTWPQGVHIGMGCHIGEEAVILTHDRTRGLYLDTYIGDRTIIGPRAIILPGVTVGADCLVEPGALVRTDMPDHSVARGNPAKVEPRE
jgi:acetyltransferase-like isoleucine patch superfamily enzyme